MKVKELIELLQNLDQEKNIWVLYDTFEPQEPDFEICKEGDAIGVCKVGDYIHITS